MDVTALDNFFWVAGFFNYSILLAVLVGKHRARRFPFFTSMVAFVVGRTIALFFIHRYGGGNAYYYTYWALVIIDVAFQLIVLYEVASKTFCPNGRWAPGIRRTFLWMIAASVTMAAVLAWLSQPATATRLGTIIMRGNFSTSVLVSELFVGMIVLSVTTGLPWRTHVARIVQGLGVPAVVGILIEASQSYFGDFRGPVYQLLSHIQIGTNMIAQIFLIGTLAREAPEPRALPAQLQRQLLHLNRQTSLALDYLRPRRRA